MQIYLHNGKEQFGPYSKGEIQSWLKTGQINENFLFFIVGESKDWTAINGSFLTDEDKADLKQNTDLKSYEKLLESVLENAQLRLDSMLTEKSASGIFSLFSKGKRPLDEYDDLMVTFDKGKKEYGPYKLENAISYEGIEKAYSMRLARGDGKTFQFNELMMIWEESLVSEKSKKTLSKLSLRFDEKMVSDKIANEILNEIKETKKLVEEQKPLTPTIKKQLKEFGLDTKAIKTRREGRYLVEAYSLYYRANELGVELPEGYTLDIAYALIEKKEKSLIKKQKQQDKLQRIKGLEDRGIQLNHPISEEELDEIYEDGVPNTEQLAEYSNLKLKLDELGIEFKPCGKKEPNNYSSSSINWSIELMDEMLTEMYGWDDDLMCQYIQGEDHEFELEREPTESELFQIHKEIAKLIMVEEYEYDEQIIIKILRKVCKGMKIKKERF